MRCCAPLLLSVLLASVAGSADGETAVLAVPVPKSAAADSHSLGVGVGVPILFERNVGQADPRALYVARCGESVVYFGDSTVFFAVPDDSRIRVLRLGFGEVAQSTNVRGEGLFHTSVNSFRGSGPEDWHTNIPAFERLVYESVAPGVDVVFYTGLDGVLEYDFVLQPAADPRSICMRFEGGETPRIVGGEVIIKIGSTDVVQRAPVAYQSDERGKSQIAARYRLNSDRSVGVSLGAYDPSRPLVVDPAVTFATRMLGASNAFELGVDAGGNIVIVASTFASDLVLVAPYQTDQPGRDAFVVKLNSTRTAYVFATYLGGDADDYASGLAMTVAGSIVIAGGTTSANFPLQSPVQAAIVSGTYDTFAARLSPNGQTLEFSTYLGGIGADVAEDVAVDVNGAIYTTGITSSPDYPNSLALSSFVNGGAFLTKIDPSIPAVAYSTLIDGDGYDKGWEVEVDSTGAATVYGETASVSCPLVNPLRSTRAAIGDVFLTKVNSAGTAAVFSTYFGGSTAQGIGGLALDSAGNIYLSGGTSSPDFPLVNAYHSTVGDGFGFLSRLSPSGAITFSSYFGVRGNPLAIAVEPSGTIVACGTTTDPNFVQTLPVYGFAPSYPNLFVARVSTSGEGVLSTSLLGNAAPDAGIAIIAPGIVAIAGTAYLGSFPLVNPIETSGTCFALVADIRSCRLTTTISAAPNPVSSGQEVTYTVNVTNYGPDPAENLTIYSGISDHQVFVRANASQGPWTLEQPWSVRNDAGTLPAGATATVTATWRVTASSGQTILSVGSATSTTGEIDEADNAIGVFPVVVGPDLTLTKSAVGSFTAGALGRYDLGVTNAGDGATSGTVTITDTLPTGVSFVYGSGAGWTISAAGQAVTCTRESAIAAGASSVVSLDVLVALNAGASVTNTATVNAEFDANTSNNVVSISTPVAPPSAADCALTKSHVGAFLAGTEGTYTLRVTNVGTAPTPGAITVVDALPAGLEFVSTSGAGWQSSSAGQRVELVRSAALAAGASSEITLTVRALVDAIPMVTNVATVSSPGDSNSANNSASDSTEVLRPSADVALALVESADPVQNGAQLAYEIRVPNLGPQSALDVVATMSVPAGTVFAAATSTQGTVTGPAVGGGGSVSARFGTIPAGVTAIATVFVAVTATPGAVLSATAAVTTASADAVPGNNSASQATAVVAPTSSADLGVSVVADPDPVRVGQRLSYSVSVTNRGPDVATDVVAVDVLSPQARFDSATLSSGSLEVPAQGASGTVRASIGNIAPGAVVTLTIDVHIVGPPGTIDNLSSVVGSGADPFLANNVATIATTVVPGNVPVIASVTVASSSGSPWRLRIQGSNFSEGVEVRIGDDDEAWDDLRRRSDTQLRIGKGRPLKSRFPRGVSVRIRVRNPDGSEAETSFTR